MYTCQDFQDHNFLEWWSGTRLCFKGRKGEWNRDVLLPLNKDHFCFSRDTDLHHFTEEGRVGLRRFVFWRLLVLNHDKVVAKHWVTDGDLDGRGDRDKDGRYRHRPCYLDRSVVPGDWGSSRRDVPLRRVMESLDHGEQTEKVFGSDVSPLPSHSDVRETGSDTKEMMVFPGT